MTRLNNLDVLRGVAALAVVAFHVNIAAPDILPTAARFGWLGVDLFFIISGAVIPVSIVSIRERYRSAWLPEYFRRRFFRIYPLYALTGLIFIFFSDQKLLAHSADYIALQIGTHAFMVHNFAWVTWQGLHDVTWSLAIEAEFYIIIALTWRYIEKLPTAVVVIAGIVIAQAWHLSVRYALSDYAHMQFILDQLPGRIDEFALGFAIFRLSLLDQPWRRRLDIVGLAAAILGAALISSWISSALDPVSPLSVLGVGWNAVFGGGAATHELVALSFGLLIFGATRLQENIVSRALSQFGVISYGLYLWHTLLIGAFKSAGWSGAPLIAGVVLSTIMLAWLSYHFFERFFLQKSSPSVATAT